MPREMNSRKLRGTSYIVDSSIKQYAMPEGGHYCEGFTRTVTINPSTPFADSIAERFRGARRPNDYPHERSGARSFRSRDDDDDDDDDMSDDIEIVSIRTGSPPANFGHSSTVSNSSHRSRRPRITYGNSSADDNMERSMALSCPHRLSILDNMSGRGSNAGSSSTGSRSHRHSSSRPSTRTHEPARSESGSNSSRSTCRHDYHSSRLDYPLPPVVMYERLGRASLNSNASSRSHDSRRVRFR